MVVLSLRNFLYSCYFQETETFSVVLSLLLLVTRGSSSFFRKTLQSLTSGFAIYGKEVLSLVNSKSKERTTPKVQSLGNSSKSKGNFVREEVPSLVNSKINIRFSFPHPLLV